MEFKGQYLNFSEYKELGGSLDLMPFNLLEFEARRKIDEHTQGRLKNIENQDFVVKSCMYKLIKTMDIDESFLNASVDERNKYIYDIIREYLVGYIVDGEHVLFLG